MYHVTSIFRCQSSVYYRYARFLSVSAVNSKIRNDPNSLNIFDRNTKTLQRQRAALAEDVNLYDYLKDEIGFRLADRVYDIKRKFKLAADIGLL